MAETETVEKTKELAEKGINVAQPTPELMEALKKVGETMTQEWIEETGETGKAVLKAYQQ
jgi:TRAP-type C4-dicarboxylate transport system substrate-binding protein